MELCGPGAGAARHQRAAQPGGADGPNQTLMTRYILRKFIYGMLVMLGVVIAVFFLFQGFGDPSRLVMGQRADAATQENIRKELYLDQPRWKQFVLYLDDVSPIGIHSREEIRQKGLKG